jgi:hypothetical protein
MTTARTLTDFYLPVQTDHDPTGDSFTLSVDGGSTFPYTADWFTSLTAPASVVAATPQAKTGLTWYYGRVLSGSGASSSAVLQHGRNTVIGKINDGRQIPWLTWTIYIQRTE